MESQKPVIKKSAYHKTYKILTEHEVRILEVVRKHGGDRYNSALDLHMTERAVIALLSRVRLKLEGAAKANRKYRAILKRKR